MPDGADNAGGKGAKSGRITAADLLDLERPDGGHNRACLGMLERAFRYGYIDLIPVDVPDLVRGVEALTQSGNERIAALARSLQTRFMEYNAKLIMAAEKLSQAERLAETKLPPPPGQTPQTVIVIQGDGAQVAMVGQGAAVQPAAPAPVAQPLPPVDKGGGDVRLEL